jgi:hypothetical protein
MTGTINPAPSSVGSRSLKHRGTGMSIAITSERKRGYHQEKANIKQHLGPSTMENRHENRVKQTPAI